MNEPRTDLYRPGTDLINVYRRLSAEALVKSLNIVNTKPPIFTNDSPPENNYKILQNPSILQLGQR